MTWAWSVRGNIADKGLRRIMSTRSIENAAKLIAAGELLDDVKATYFASWSTDERAKVNG